MKTIGLAMLIAIAVPSVGLAESPAHSSAAMDAAPAADNAAMAATLEDEAKNATAEADKHRQMGDNYKKQGGVVIAKWHMDDHCRDLAKKYDAIAKTKSEMAKAHRKMAEAK